MKLLVEPKESLRGNSEFPCNTGAESGHYWHKIMVPPFTMKYTPSIALRDSKS